jgi:hypothetical protein
VETHKELITEMVKYCGGAWIEISRATSSGAAVSTAFRVCVVFLDEEEEEVLVFRPASERVEKLIVGRAREEVEDLEEVVSTALNVCIVFVDEDVEEVLVLRPASERVEKLMVGLAREEVDDLEEVVPTAFKVCMVFVEEEEEEVLVLRPASERVEKLLVGRAREEVEDLEDVVDLPARGPARAVAARTSSEREENSIVMDVSECGAKGVCNRNSRL